MPFDVRAVFPVAIGLSAFAIVAGFMTGFFEPGDRIAFDRFSIAAIDDRTRDDRILLVAVDQKTVERYGEETYWTRSRYEGLLRRIQEEKPKAVYLDYFFSEKSRPENVDWDLIAKSSGMTGAALDSTYAKYDKRLKEKDFVSEIDQSLAGAMGEHPNVYLPMLYKGAWDGKPDAIYSEPFEAFRKSAIVGSVNVFPDPDGVERRMFPRFENEKPIPLLLAEKYSGNYLSPKTSVDGSVLIRYSSRPYEGFPVIPFEFAYNGIFKDRLGVEYDPTGKIVIVGDLGEKMGDMHVVPTSDGKPMPGMETIANTVRSFLDKTTVRVPSDTTARFSVAFAFLFFSSVFFFLHNVTLSVTLAATGIAATYYFSYLGFKSGIWIAPMPLASCVVLPFLSGSFKLYAETKREREKVHKIFSRYVHPSIVEELVKHGEKLNLNGETREVTVLFADIQGFTSISEKLPPQAVIAELDRFFSITNHIVFNNRGTINKYIGDAVMAFWGAPNHEKDHARLACAAALEIVHAVEHLNSHGKTEGMPEIRVRVGVATGEAIVGNVGDELFSDYTVMGDRVNFASRLEGATRKYDVDVLVSKRTAELAGATFDFRMVDSVRMKGKKHADEIFELLPHFEDGVDRRKMLERHEIAFAMYRDGDFKSAKKLFQTNAKRGDGVAKAFLERIEESDDKPPEGFDGSFAFDSK